MTQIDIMSKEKWSETKTKAFVHSYLNKPALWDSSCADYTKKKAKEAAYGKLQDEFNLSLGEVRNKIRIFRTTFNQERKKEDTIKNYKPKLQWFELMKSNFKDGKVKSFSKSSTPKVKNEKEAIVQYIYTNDNDQEDIAIDEINMKSDNENEIIIEPFEEYDEEEDEEDEREHEMMKLSTHLHSPPKPQSNQQQQQSAPFSSNELFLQSLKSSLDKLSEEKNMRARIAIQESLYKIMYEK